jgi:hypothetical protein
MHITCANFGTELFILFVAPQNTEMKTKEPLERVSIPPEMFAEARELAKREHIGVAQAPFSSSPDSGSSDP